MFPCDKGSWICTTEAAYWGFIYGPQPDCPSVHPQTTAPPPGECQLVNGVCQFTNSIPKCKAWVEPFNGNKCGSVAEYGAIVKLLVSTQHQISFVCLSTTPVSGMTRASPGRDTALVATSVALLMNTMHFCMDYIHHVPSHPLDGSHLSPQASVLLGKTTVIGMVSTMPLRGIVQPPFTYGLSKNQS